MEYKYVELADYVDVIGGYAFKSKMFTNEGIPVLKIKNVQQGKVDLTDTQYISNDLYDNSLEKYLVKNKDILIAMTGQGSVGRVGRVYKDDNDKFLLNQRVGNIIVKDNQVLDSNYLFYILSSRKYEEILFNAASGSGQPNLSPSIIKTIKIPWIEIDKQRFIGGLLDLLDSKIRNNTNVISSLECITNEIFKRWFIDFEFPNEQGLPYRSSGGDMVESELGWVPKLWCVSNINEFAKEIIITGKTPSTKRTDYYAEQGYPFITIPDMHGNVFSTNTQRYLSIEGDLSQNKKRVPKNSLLVSCIATPGLVNITSEDSHFNQQINAFTPRFRDLYYLYFSLKNLSDYIRDLGSSGSTTLNLNKSQFSKIEIIKPTDDVLEEFSNTVQPFFQQILNLTMENQKLRDLRDTLLPKLLSGEIEIPDESVVDPL